MNKVFNAKIKNIPHPGNDLYVWRTLKELKDESWEPIDNIMCFVSFPTLVNKREQFCFTAKDMVKVKSYE